MYVRVCMWMLASGSVSGWVKECACVRVLCVFLCGVCACARPSSVHACLARAMPVICHFSFSCAVHDTAGRS